MQASARVLFAIPAVIGFGVAAPAAIVRDNLVLKQGDAISGSTASGVNPAFVDSNGRVGFLVEVSPSTRSIFYDTGAVFNSADALPDVVTGGEGSIGVSDAGDFVYSPTFNGGDAVYTNLGKLLAEGDPDPATGLFVTFGSRPSMLSDATAIWVGGWTATAGGGTVGRILYRCPDISDINTAVSVMKSGDIVGPAAITASGIGFTYDFSDNGAHHLTRLILDTGSTSTNDVVALDSAVLAQEGQPAPGGAENYATFNVVSVNNAGDYVFSSNTSAATTADEVLIHNGAIVYREGQTHDGVTLSGVVDGADINNLGWVAFVWDSSAGETLFAVNSANFSRTYAILSVGEGLDFDGDGAADFNLTDFNAATGITLDDGFADNGRFYAHVDMTPAGGGTAVDAVIGVSVLARCPADLDFNGTVDLADLTQQLSNFGSSGTDVGPADGDIDNDYDVELGDLTELLSAFGTTCP